MAAEATCDALVWSSVSKACICVTFGFEKIPESIREGCSPSAGQIFGKDGAHLRSKQSLKNEW